MNAANELLSSADWVSVFLSFIALIVAIMSIFFTKKTIDVQIKHNKLSVRPIPYIRIGDYKNKLFVKLENHGTGPMIVNWVTISKENEKFNSLFEAISVKDENIIYEFTAKYRGRVLAPGESLIIVQYEEGGNKNHFKDMRESIRSKLSKFNIDIDFSDIYRDRFPKYSKKLTWFARAE